MSKLLAVVGDIHGDSIKLAQILRTLRPAEYRVVFVGDYINRGDDTRTVLDLLCDAAQLADDWVFLMGNHELALLEYLRSGNFSDFASVGGIATLKSYLPEPRGNIHQQFCSAFPIRHRLFLEALKVYWETDDLLVSHMGFSPAAPYDRSIEAMVTTPHPEMFTTPRTTTTLTVCGHYSQVNGVPYVSDSVICVDTGCGSLGGPLTAVLLPSRHFIQIKTK